MVNSDRKKLRYLQTLKNFLGADFEYVLPYDDDSSFDGADYDDENEL